MKPLAVLLLAALPLFAQAEEEEVPDEHKLTIRGCSATGGWCAADADVLQEYIRKRWEIAKERDRLRERCTAKLEVVPPAPPPKKVPIDPKTNRPS